MESSATILQARDEERARAEGIRSSLRDEIAHRVAKVAASEWRQGRKRNLDRLSAAEAACIILDEWRQTFRPRSANAAPEAAPAKFKNPALRVVSHGQLSRRAGRDRGCALRQRHVPYRNEPGIA